MGYNFTFNNALNSTEFNTVFLKINDTPISIPTPTTKPEPTLEPEPTPILEMNYEIIHKKGYSFQKGFYEDLDANFHILQAKEDVSDNVREEINEEEYNDEWDSVDLVA